MLIAAAAVYGGVSYTALKREQLNELEALCHMLRLMQDELETRALPLPFFVKPPSMVAVPPCSSIWPMVISKPWVSIFAPNSFT